MVFSNFIKLLQTLARFCKVFQLLQKVVGCLADVKYMHECTISHEAATNVFYCAAIANLPGNFKF